MSARVDENSETVVGDNVVIEPETPFHGDSRQFEMSRYIDLNLYHEVERSHPYYVEMIAEIVRQINDSGVSADSKLLEIGAGTGLATESLASCDGVNIDALELDEKCVGILRGFIGDRANCFQGNGITYCKYGFYDFVVSVFAHDHINYESALEFTKNIRANLIEGGLYIMGGELLREYASDEERIGALQDYHGFIIGKALKENNFELAQIEINALKSGILEIGDFKRHEAQFEKELLSSGFKMKHKRKLGPEVPADVGGVFVYVFEAV